MVVDSSAHFHRENNTDLIHSWRLGCNQVLDIVSEASAPSSSVIDGSISVVSVFDESSGALTCFV